MSATVSVARESSGGEIPLQDIESPVVRQVLDLWRGLCGTRSFPAREQVSPRDFGRLLRNIILLKVVDGGADYEYRIVGDIQAQAYGNTTYQNQRLSDVIATTPVFGAGLKTMFDGVRMQKTPSARRGWVGRNMPDARFVYHETVVLPLGAADGAVDHILIASVYVPREGYKLD